MTSGYINQTAGAVCAAGAGNCVAGSTTGWAEKNYNTILFSQATNSGTSPAAYASYALNGGQSSGNTLTDTTNTVIFDMLADGGAAASPFKSNDYWGSSLTGTASITIPIGVFGVQNVWTMLNNQWGSVGGNDTTVTFNFGSTANATSGLTQVVVNLLNTSNTEGGSGQIRAGTDCTGTTTVACSSSNKPLGPLAASSTVSGITVLTNNVFTFNYNVAAGTFVNTTGSLNLDDQGFQFGSTHLTDYLVSMVVKENSVGGSNASQTALSAITVNTAAVTATPEPSTVLLLLGGLGLMGAARIRRRS